MRHRIGTSPPQGLSIRCDLEFCLRTDGHSRLGIQGITVCSDFRVITDIFLPVDHVDVFCVEHAVTASIRKGSADEVSTDAHEERKEHRCEGSSDAGGARGREESTGTEDRTSNQETTRSGVPEAPGLDDVVDLVGENLKTVLPHVRGACSETGDGCSSNYRQENVHVEHGIDRVVGCDGAESEEPENTCDDASRRVIDVTTVVAGDVLISNILVCGGVHCLTFPVRWPLRAIVSGPQALGTVHPGPPGTSAVGGFELY